VDLHADKTKESRLAALVLLADPNSGRRFIFRDLGPFAELDKLLDDLETLRSKIAALRDKIADLDRNEQKKEFSALLEQLTNLQKEKDKKNTEACRILLDPFEQQIRNLKQLYIAPDGRLNFLSFASTRLPDGRFLAERQRINRLQTGRDLIENGKDFSRGKGLIAVGGVTYGPKPAKDGEEQEKLEPQPKFVLRTTRQFGDGFVYLKGSRIEAKNIFAKYENNTQGKRFIGDDASEYNLKHLKQPPSILHLSTHGFYRSNNKDSMLADEAPLLLSGLALAGANNGLQGKLDKHGDDGLLYSLEVLGLNLQGTELVSLSACDTGKGVVDYSEGVYGLVRAFRTAGAANVLMTLTPVGDKSSRDFMETFYENWLYPDDQEKNWFDGARKSTRSPAEALHQTRLDFIRNNRPVKDWAPYVLVGK
jgi:CHAT domain-containing protein